jgi:uncharacterized protein YkwD
MQRIRHDAGQEPMIHKRLPLTLLIAIGLLAATLAPAAAAPGSGSKSITSLNAVSWSAEPEECAFLGIINTYRKQNGLGTLTISLTLSAAAEYHSADMAKNNYFSHTLFDGTTWSQNIANFGYPSSTSRAENIAAGHATAEEVFQQWKNSPGHNANMLSSKFNAIGIGRFGSDSSKYKWYWTNTFGSRIDQAYSCSGQSTGGGETSGSLLRITGGGRTSSSTASTLAYDGSTSTAWYTTASGTPTAAYVYFDLGVSKSIAQLKWLFSKSGYSDSYKIQISSDKSTWTTISTRSNGKGGSWQTLAVGKKARYVRFYFSNPNKDKVLGYLGEVKFYA